MSFAAEAEQSTAAIPVQVPFGEALTSTSVGPEASATVAEDNPLLEALIADNGLLHLVTGTSVSALVSELGGEAAYEAYIADLVSGDRPPEDEAVGGLQFLAIACETDGDSTDRLRKEVNRLRNEDPDTGRHPLWENAKNVMAELYNNARKHRRSGEESARNLIALWQLSDGNLLVTEFIGHMSEAHYDQLVRGHADAKRRHQERDAKERAKVPAGVGDVAMDVTVKLSDEALQAFLDGVSLDDEDGFDFGGKGLEVFSALTTDVKYDQRPDGRVTIGALINPNNLAVAA